MNTQQQAGGLCAATAPTLYALVFAIPASNANAGFLGLGISWFTPVFALVSYSLTWSVPAYLWVGFCGTLRIRSFPLLSHIGTRSTLNAIVGTLNAIVATAAAAVLQRVRAGRAICNYCSDT